MPCPLLRGIALSPPPPPNKVFAHYATAPYIIPSSNINFFLATGKMADHETLQQPALGRALKLGMLYDIRSEEFIPECTILDSVLQQKVNTVYHHQESQLSFIAGNSFDQKASALGIGTSVQLACLGGRIDVKGSAKYWNDVQTSGRQARIALLYKDEKTSENLSTEDIDNDTVKRVDALAKGRGTHVVTGISYGMQTVFVFDRVADSHENIDQVQEDLNYLVKKIPIIKELGTNIDEGDKIRCRIYGDLKVEGNPKTFVEAVAAYKQLTSRPSHGKRVYLKIVTFCKNFSSW